MIHIQRQEQSDIYRITSDEGYLTFDLFNLNKESCKLLDGLLSCGFPVSVNWGVNISETTTNKLLYSKFRKAACLIATPWLE